MFLAALTSSDVTTNRHASLVMKSANAFHKASIVLLNQSWWPHLRMEVFKTRAYTLSLSLVRVQNDLLVLLLAAIDQTLLVFEMNDC